VHAPCFPPLTVPSVLRPLHHHPTPTPARAHRCSAGVPLTLLLGAPVSSLFDMAFAVAIPLHFHVGLRATALDYAHFWLSPAGQKAVYAVMAGITGLTAFGLVKFNLTDVGITQGVKELFIEQAPPAPKRKLGGNPF
jgi:hypothetical protein